MLTFTFHSQGRDFTTNAFDWLSAAMKVAQSNGLAIHQVMCLPVSVEAR